MKWIGWLLKLSITIVMVSLLTVLTTGYVVNHYIGSLLSSYNIPVASQAPSVVGIFKEMLGLGADSGGKTGNGAVDDSVGKSNIGVDASSDPSKGTLDQNKDNGKSTSGDTKQDIPDDALPVMGGISSGDSQQEGQVIVSPDDLVAKKDGIASTEKEEVFTMLMSKLPEEEMRKLTDAMEGGLTESEIFDIEQILSKYLDKEEYSKMMEILQK